MTSLGMKWEFLLSRPNFLKTLSKGTCFAHALSILADLKRSDCAIFLRLYESEPLELCSTLPGKFTPCNVERNGCHHTQPTRCSLRRSLNVPHIDGVPSSAPNTGHNNSSNPGPANHLGPQICTQHKETTPAPTIAAPLLTPLLLSLSGD